MTVKVWFVREGPSPTSGGPAYVVPLKSCAEVLGLAAHQWLSGLDKTPRFAEQTPGLGNIAGYKHVICEIDESEAKASGWKAGFYKIDLDTEEVINRLGEPRLPWES